MNYIHINRSWKYLLPGVLAVMVALATEGANGRNPPRRTNLGSTISLQQLLAARAGAVTNTASTMTNNNQTAGSGKTTSSKSLRLNFRGVPLDVVLNYLSEAAGFIIVKATEVKGKIDVWSHQPLNEEEAVNLLNTVLNQNGCAAIRNGRTLTIVNREETKKRNLAVKVGRDPQAVPNNDEMVTQVIPIRYAVAAQLVKDLQPLLPAYAILTANESGNALVLTEVQSNIRRMMEIVQALDTTMAGNTTLRVLPLRYADAKELASIIKELFPAASNSGRGASNAGPNPDAMVFGGGPGGPGGGLPGSSASSGGQTEGRRVTPQVTVVADENTNALIVNAPDDLQVMIGKLVESIDNNAENITALRLFPLKHANPTEMVDVLSSLFPDETSSESSRSEMQSGGGFPGAMPGMNASATGASKQAKRKGRVLAVADERTGGIIVSAASEMMPHIEQVIQQLDADPARKQKVYVYALQNASVANVQQVLQDMFQSQNARNSSTGAQQGTDVLATRQSQASQYTGQSSFGFGSSTTSGASRGGSRGSSGF